jgi:hypothetical protein
VPRRRLGARARGVRRRACPPLAQAREAALKSKHEAYLEDNPEVKALLADFISCALVMQPVDVFEFARDHFKGTATAVEEEDEADGDGAEAADDLDDMDDLDRMGDSANGALTAYLKHLFESMDKDSSGSISQVELKAKLAADNELKELVKMAGGDGDLFVLEQLDMDGDGEIVRARPRRASRAHACRPLRAARPPQPLVPRRCFATVASVSSSSCLLLHSYWRVVTLSRTVRCADVDGVRGDAGRFRKNVLRRGYAGTTSLSTKECARVRWSRGRGRAFVVSGSRELWRVRRFCGGRLCMHIVRFMFGRPLGSTRRELRAYKIYFCT